MQLSLAPLILATTALSTTALGAEPVGADAPASAAAGAAVAQLAPVTVAAVRDPAMLPYAQINALLRGFEQHGQGLFRIDFRLGAKDPAKPLIAPKLALLHGEMETPIPVAPNGRFTLPTLTVDDAQRAELASNQPRGTVSMNATIRLTTPPPALDIATVRRIVATADRLRGELLPWYARWLFPRVDAVRVCSRRAAWSMQWSDHGQTLTVALPVDPDKHDEIDPDDASAKSRVCAMLTGQEPWPEAATLLADEDTTLSLQWNR